MHILTKEEVIERLMAVHNGKVIERQQALLKHDCVVGPGVVAQLRQIKNLRKGGGD